MNLKKVPLNKVKLRTLRDYAGRIVVVNERCGDFLHHGFGVLHDVDNEGNLLIRMYYAIREGPSEIGPFSEPERRISYENVLSLWREAVEKSHEIPPQSTESTWLRR